MRTEITTTDRGNAGMSPPRLSIIIPAFNEALYLPGTLNSLRIAARECPWSSEIIVVDNDSADRTAAVAEEHEATVFTEHVHNVGRVRNRGAAHARGDILVFVDADTTVPRSFLRRIVEAMAEPDCFGGSVGVAQTARSQGLAVYLKAWEIMAGVFTMVQGATQFCRRSVFADLGGYDESHFMGEDVDFYWRLNKLAKRRGGYVKRLADVTVVPSARRWDKLPVWRVLLTTNPLTALVFRRAQWAWRDWYVNPPR